MADWERSAKSMRQSQNLVALGRWVSNFGSNDTIEKRVISPRFTESTNKSSAIGLLETILHELTGRKQLNQVLLLITPTRRHKTQRKLHCFDRRTREHLGVTSITELEVDLLKKYEMLLKYEIMFADQYIQPKQIATNKSVISELFLRDSGAPSCVGRGKFYGLDRRRFQSTLNFVKKPTVMCDVSIQADLTQPEIKSLRRPKIPVRMRNPELLRHWNFVNNTAS
ncbi:uncharacterized protein LOC115631414 [Scaptodrosophila lebanonensis]|uniref:Uncharacterized protein LOC115631414 n=1 Tax=Drosophila lebanonensis TaxID=7225 RepID=A0A6J2U7P4_DROLE|nr:uncharacterized protein LOC115631414 [Scaptodrosophila lebanonensis]